jgi:hypothetical protein
MSWTKPVQMGIIKLTVAIIVGEFSPQILLSITDYNQMNINYQLKSFSSVNSSNVKQTFSPDQVVPYYQQAISL